MSTLLRRLGTFDAALIVMGGIIGSGIFITPSTVARYLPNGFAIMGVWIVGGCVALLGAAIFAELAERRPNDGGLYAYMRDAYHPALAFMYGWTLLLVSQSGGMAAAAVTFANYFQPLTGIHADPRLLAVAAIALFTAVNALGVRLGATAQNVFMVVKIAAIAAFVLVGLFAPHAAVVATTGSTFAGGGLFAAMGLAMVPVLFSYSGWQTSSFMSAELKDPAKTLPRGMLLGVGAVVVLYLAVNAVCLAVLGVGGLAATHTPASAVAQLAFGSNGARLVAALVAISTLGFLSNQILTSPRVYFQMATDGIFFRSLSRVSRRSRAPVIAIVLQGIIAIAIALSGSYSQILNYVTSVDYVFFGFSAIALIIFRLRDARSASGDAKAEPAPVFRVPGHPWTTLLFMLIAWAVVGDTLIKSPLDTAIGLGILLSGLPIYFIFAALHRNRQPIAD